MSRNTMIILIYHSRKLLDLNLIFVSFHVSNIPLHLENEYISKVA
jgi:hypothetical protein